jgi:hypothetical protein
MTANAEIAKASSMFDIDLWRGRKFIAEIQRAHGTTRMSQSTPERQTERRSGQ